MVIACPDKERILIDAIAYCACIPGLINIGIAHRGKKLSCPGAINCVAVITPENGIGNGKYTAGAARRHGINGATFAA